MDGISGHEQAPEIPRKYDNQHADLAVPGVCPVPNQPIGEGPVGAPPPYSTIIVQGNQQVVYPPGTQIVYRMPQPLTNPPDDHLIYAILVTVFCFWPTGIIAIIKSLDVQKSSQMGDPVAAEQACRASLQMSRISLGIGVLIYMLLAVILAIEFMLIFTL